MKSRLVVGITLLVALFVLVSAGGLSFYLTPYEATLTEYGVAHESTDTFEAVVDRADVDADDAESTDALSPNAHRAFEDATQQPIETDGDPRPRGWFGWQWVDVAVCQEAMLVCDEYAETPGFPVHDRWASDSKTTGYYTMVEHDDELYVVKTKIEHTVSTGQLLAFPTGLLLVVFAGLLATVGYKYREAPTTGVFGITAVGAFVGLWPYFVMGVGIDSYWWLVIPLVCLGIVVQGRQLLALSRHVEADTRLETESNPVPTWGLLLAVVVAGLLSVVLPWAGLLVVVLLVMSLLWLVVPKRTA
ncbi:hypothetical protein ACLI4Y_10415 [Natrialbaceae archaeon A-CW3]